MPLLARLGKAMVGEPAMAQQEQALAVVVGLAL
jgi:hypothetical protein